MEEPAVHFVVPDTQAKPGVPTEHLTWIGQFLVDEFAGHPNLKWVHLGDHADMPSLSLYDKGKKSMEGRRYVADIEAANNAWRLLNEPLTEYNAHQRASKHVQWWPAQRVITLGNHEHRIVRVTELDAQLDGIVTLDDLDYARSGWETVDFLTPKEIDGVSYCHYFTNHMTGKPLGGVASTRIKTIGHSFTMGHQQTLDYTKRYVRGVGQNGLIVGACYLHDEEYKGVQGNDHWRGIVIKRNVVEGDYDPQFISLEYLRGRYGA